MRLTERERSLALIGLLGLGCESVLGLGETSFSEAEPNVQVAESCGGDAEPAGGGDGGGSGPGNEGGRGGVPNASGTTTGGRASDGRTSGDTNGGGATTDGATSGGSNDGGDGNDNSGPLVAILQSRRAGRCVGVVPEHEGVEEMASVALVECNRQDPLQHWQRDRAGRLFCPAAGMYLQAAESDVPDATVFVGSSIDPLTFQTWLFENVHLVNLGGYCVDMPFGNFSDNARAQLASCHPGPPQAWTLDSEGAITHDGQCLDIFDGIAKDGQSVQTYGCQGSPNQLFVFHEMRLQFGGMCVGVPGAFPPLEHALLELQTCLSETHRDAAKQQFYVEGAVRILGQCLEAGTGHELGLESCTDSEAQVWRWIP